MGSARIHLEENDGEIYCSSTQVVLQMSPSLCDANKVTHIRLEAWWNFILSFNIIFELIMLPENISGRLLCWSIAMVFSVWIQIHWIHVSDSVNNSILYLLYMLSMPLVVTSKRWLICLFTIVIFLLSHFFKMCFICTRRGKEAWWCSRF